MGLYMLVFLGGAPLGSPLVGWAAEQFGARMSLIGGGVISALAAVGAALLLARARDVPARSYLRLAPPPPRSAAPRPPPHRPLPHPPPRQPPPPGQPLPRPHRPPSRKPLAAAPADGRHSPHDG